jgi:hypothetical protein
VPLPVRGVLESPHGQDDLQPASWGEAGSGVVL